MSRSFIELTNGVAAEEGMCHNVSRRAVVQTMMSSCHAELHVRSCSKHLWVKDEIVVLDQDHIATQQMLIGRMTWPTQPVCRSYVWTHLGRRRRTGIGIWRLSGSRASAGLVESDTLASSVSFLAGFLSSARAQCE
jgi:hypothetical protein